MPLGPGVRFRVKTFPSGKKVRLAFRGNKVVETKTMHDVLSQRRRRKRKA